MCLVEAFLIGSAIAAISRKRFEETVFPAICTMIFTLLCSGLVGYLKAGLFLIPILTGLSLVALIIKRENIKQYVITPGFMAYILLCIFFLLYSYGRLFDSNEAFTQFGPTVLNLYSTESLKNTNEYYNLNTPFPFSTLWSYYCVRTSGGFSEWICLFSNNVYIAAAMMPLFKNVRSLKKDIAGWLLTLLFCLLVPVLKLPDAYRRFDMSVPQAVTMVYTLLMCYSLLKEKTETIDMLFVSIGIFASCTLTKYGVFASIPLITGISAVGFYEKNKRKNILIAVFTGSCLTIIWRLFQYFNGETMVIKVVLIPAVCCCSVLCALWIERIIDMYRYGNKKVSVIMLTILVACIVAGTMYILWHSVHRNYAIEKIIEFSDKLCIECKEESPYILGKNTIKMYDAVFLFLSLAVSGVACGIMQRRKDQNAEKVYVFNFSYIFGVCIYLFFLLIMYINVLREPPRAVPVPTIAEYTTSIILLSFVVIYMEVHYINTKETVLLAFVCFLMVCGFTDPVEALFKKTEEIPEYESVYLYKQKGNFRFSQEDRVFYIDVNLVEPVPPKFSWQVFPAGTGSINGLNYNPDPYSLSDIEQTITTYELEEILDDGKYSYVYLKNVDDFFKLVYQDMFVGGQQNIKNDALYQIKHSHNGQIEIEYIVSDQSEE